MTGVIGVQDRAPWRWVSLASGPIIVTDASLGFHFRVVLTENAVLEPPANGVNGQRITLRIEQDTTGGRTLTPNSAGFSTIGDLTAATTAGAVEVWEMLYDEVAGMWEIWSLTASGAAGANTALSNLAAVAINTSLVSDTNNTDDLGTTGTRWKDGYFAGVVYAPVVNGGTTTTVYGASSTAAVYIDANGIGNYISGKPVSVWIGSLLAVDAAISVGAVGTSGFTKSAAGASGNFDCLYNGTVAWRLESATTLYLNDCNIKTGTSTGTKIGTTTAQKLGFWGATPVVQQAAIADAVDAADAVTKLNTLLATLRTLGMIAP